MQGKQPTKKKKLVINIDKLNNDENKSTPEEIAKKLFLINTNSPVPD